MDDLISRKALCEYALNHKDKCVTPNDIMRFPSAQPEKCEECGNFNKARLLISQPERTDCTECPEYDHERHFCPRYCKTIRQTLEETKQERTGRWMATEADEPCFYRCSECGRLIDERENFCPNCGAKMEGENEAD